MRRNDITPKLLRELYYKKFLSKKEIALLLKCNITTIHKKMRKFGIPARKQGEAVKIAMIKQIIKIQKSKLEILYLKKKFSLSEIAKKLNHDRSIIKREAERLKIPLRSHSATMKLVANKNKVKKTLLAKLYWKEHLTPKQIGKKLNRHPETIRRLMRGYGLKRRSRSEVRTHYPRFNFSDDLLEEKAYLIGFRTGDLRVNSSAGKTSITVDCTSTKAEQLKLFRDLFNKYGHVWVSKPRSDGNRVFLVRLNHTFRFLLPKRDNIPKWIRENKNYFLSFLAGYTDAEANIGISKENVAKFALASYDKNILKQVHKKLQEIGIECNPPRIHVKKGYKKSNGCVYRNDGWRLNLNKKSSLLLLLEFLKPRLKHQKRLKDLKKAEQNIIKRNQRTLPEKTSLRYLPV